MARHDRVPGSRRLARFGRPERFGDHKLDTGLWPEIEGGVRDLARLEGEFHVVTGPVFQDARLRELCARAARLRARTGRLFPP
jgi:hypothetical protein